MTGQWHPDPHGRAEFRWHDGTNWTQHVSTGGVQSQEPVGQPPAAPWTPTQAYPAAPAYPAYPVNQYANVGTGIRPGQGRLLAAGVLSIITGAVTLLGAVWLLTVINSRTGGFLNDISGGAGTLGVLIALLFGGTFLWFGIAGVSKKDWSRLAMAIAAGIVALLYLLGLIGSGESSLLVPILWFGTILGLAVSFNPNQ